MKMLHTGDWHIGRHLNQHALLEDQRHALGQLLTLIRREQPDVLIVAGDLYDRALAPREAMTLVDTVLTEVVLDLAIPAIVIGGNHDGRERLDYGSAILRQKGLHMIGTYRPIVTPILLTGKGDAAPVAFWPVPFVKPVEYRDLTGSGNIPDYNAMYREIVSDITARMNPDIPNVLVTHGLILSDVPQDGDIDDSVRPIEIGGVSYADAGIFDAFDYVALGHLHRPQKVGSDRIRYAGSLLKYSFSEVDQKKSVTLVDLDTCNRQALPAITAFPIEGLRDLRVIRGTFDELTSLSAYTAPHRDDYLRVILTDKVRVPNPMEGLRQVYPNVLEMGYEGSQSLDGGGRQQRIKEHLENPMTLLADFYQAIRGEALPEAESALARELFDQIPEDDDATA